MITASKLELAFRCPSAFALPHHDDPSPDAEAGRARHSDLEDQLNAGIIPETWEAQWPGLLWRSEVKFAIDLATGVGRIITIPGVREYGELAPFEIAGTADAVGTNDTTLVIVDKKSFDPTVPAAADNPQVAIAALAFCRALDRSEAIVAIDHELRELDSCVLDEFQLSTFEQEARQIFVSVAAAKGKNRDGKPLTVTEGPHCRYCPAFHSCPAKQALVESVRPQIAPERLEVPFAPFVDDDDVSRAYEFVQRLRQLVKRIDAAIYARASQHPFRLPNGKLFGQFEKLGNEKLDGDIAYGVVREKYGQAIADAAVARSASKTGIAKAISKADVASKTAANKEVLEEIRARGGARREREIKIGEHSPGPRLLPIQTDTEEES